MKLALHAAKQFTTEVTADDPWMFAPGGTHYIGLGAGEGSAEIVIRVDRETATVLNAALQSANERNFPQRAFFDAEHNKLGGATAWPKRFFWSESPEPGVYVESEVTLMGREMVEGKIQRAFSPSFYADSDLPKKINRGQHLKLTAGKRGSPENPARMTGLVFPACGTLTNDPAFRKILPLWAKNAGAKTSGSVNNTQNKHIMLTPEEKAALQARKKILEQNEIALTAKVAADANDAASAEQLRSEASELVGITAQIDADELRATNVVLTEAVTAQRTKDAKAAVQLAVKRGAIPAGDTELQAKWEKRCTEDQENLELLASMKGSPALDRNVQPNRIILGGNVQIQKDDIRTVLRAYSQETDDRKRGALYASSISTRIAELLDVPLRAADVAATAIITQRALELLKFEFPMLSRITTDMSAENAALNQGITMRTVTPPSVVAYHTTNGYVPTSTTTTDVTLTIDVHNSVPIKFNANQLAATFRHLFDEQLPAMHYSLGKDICDALYALIVTGTYTNTPVTEALIDFDRESVIALGTALTAAGNPLMGRTLLLNSSYYGKLMSDTAIVSLAANQESNIIHGNRLPNIHGFDIIEAPNLPTTGNLAGFAFTKSSMLLATRVPTDISTVFPGVSGGAVTRTVTNPDTGLSVLMIQHSNPLLGHAYLILAYMYGVDPGQVAAGTILRSAA